MNPLPSTYKLEDFQDEHNHKTRLTIAGKTSVYNRISNDQGKSGIMKRIRKDTCISNTADEADKISNFFKNHPRVQYNPFDDEVTQLRVEISRAVESINEYKEEIRSQAKMIIRLEERLYNLEKSQ